MAERRPPPSRELAGTDSLPSSVDTEQLMGHIHEFARRVKLSGTPEELESFRYLQAQMENFGYCTRLIFHDAYISLPIRSRVEVDGRRLKCITHSMSMATPSGGFSAALAYVGEGDEASIARQMCVARSCSLTVSPRRMSLLLPPGQVPLGRFISVPTNTSMRCAFLPSGEARRSTRAPNSPLRRFARSTMIAARSCASVACAAKWSMSSCRPKSTLDGARLHCSWRSLVHQQAMLTRHSFCFLAITTRGTTVSWTMAGPTPPCSKQPDCLPRDGRIGGAAFGSASGPATPTGATQVPRGTPMSIGTNSTCAALLT